MYKKILVAFDGSESSRFAIAQAVELAVNLGSELAILSVVPKVMMPIFPDEDFGAAPIAAAQDLGEYQDKMKEIYMGSLVEVERDVKEAYPDLVVHTIFKEGRPSATIVEEAEENEADLIVIGSRGLGGISGWILGSTSRRVVDSCTKPVLVVKHPL